MNYNQFRQAIHRWGQKKATVDVYQQWPLVLGDVLLSRDPSVQVPSALEGLTVVFGMGTRGTLPLSPPNVIFALLSLR